MSAVRNPLERWRRHLAKRHGEHDENDGELHTDVETAPVHVEAVLAPENDRLVPRGLQVAASWSWRLLLIAALLAGLGWLARHLSEVVIPLAVAILLTALLSPVATRLRGWGLPKGLATPISVIGGLVVVAGALTLIGTQIAGQAGALANQVLGGVNQILTFLENGPLHLDTATLNSYVSRVQQAVVSSGGTIASYAAGVGISVGHFLAGLAIAIFALFYFLADGRSIFRFLLNFVPRAARAHVDRAALKGWVSLTSYVRATILVALADALGVLIAALILRVPLAPALSMLVFLGAFVPIVGAFISGFVAVLVALVFLGWVKALIMLGAIILVMQLEGHVLQPFLLGRAVRLHPLAVLLAIAIGVIVAGIVGALVSVPILAFTKTFVADLAKGGRERLQPGAVSDAAEMKEASLGPGKSPRTGSASTADPVGSANPVAIASPGSANPEASASPAGSHLSHAEESQP